MKNVYVIRTAAVASLAAGIIGLSSLGFHGEEAPVAAALIAAEPVAYFPAAYELQPGAGEGEIFEYY